ncbi:MAG TPA: SpoIIE family protein phosphatase, partial [Actinomycetota bacterium]|nr:SpoIIE family protein phosphatase [Actinomycetota bacterium]
ARGETRPDGTPERILGTVQDVTEARRAEREHRIAATLQRSLLPERLPEIPGVELSARYVPATEESDVGGDWYDVVELPSGRIALAVGDVAGHGLRAASVMAQLRMALRAYAVEESGPADVIERVHRLFQRVSLSDMATVVYLVFDVESGEVRFANAGHPPPLVIRRDGSTEYVGGALAPPLGAMPHAGRFFEGRASLSDGDTLLLFTDGLVERRGTALDEGLDRLAREAASARGGLETLCETLLTTLVGEGVADDVAMLAVRPVTLAERPFEIRIAAEPHVLATIRRAVRRWLRAVDASEEDAYEVLAALGEACTNVIQHAYGAARGRLELRFDRADGDIEVMVRDFGTWRGESRGDGGRGLVLMRGLMDAVSIERDAAGTTVTMRRRLRRRS